MSSSSPANNAISVFRFRPRLIIERSPEEIMDNQPLASGVKYARRIERRTGRLLEELVSFNRDGNDNDVCMHDEMNEQGHDYENAYKLATSIGRRVSRLAENLTTINEAVNQEHDNFIQLKAVSREVFGAVYMCKTELEVAHADRDWKKVERVMAIMNSCQGSIRAYGGDALWKRAVGDGED
ncbi:hypothetical protein EST38_g11789 [Candolleomyces aberdarensis]|uniref:Uncharacterized protein n=1 Tax=Candolleomyces aberdarensis TaxID=2316362 RepID=A0A4Q2D406_9AGAR|nr:hypothetical protein EST38_g11789 [Candolleomyces aberdarensis]